MDTRNFELFDNRLISSQFNSELNEPDDLRNDLSAKFSAGKLIDKDKEYLVLKSSIILEQKDDNDCKIFSKINVEYLSGFSVHGYTIDEILAKKEFKEVAEELINENIYPCIREDIEYIYSRSNMKINMPKNLFTRKDK